MQKRTHFWGTGWRILVASMGFLLAFFLVHLPHGPEHWSADLQTAMLSDQLPSQHPKIVLVEVSDQSLVNNSYVSPVDRKLLADVIRALNENEVKTIALDFVFDRPTETSKDLELMKAIKSSRAKIVLGTTASTAPTDRRREFQTRFLAESGRPFGHLYYEEHRNPAIISDQVVRQTAEPAETPGVKSFADVIAQIGGVYRTPPSRYISWLRAPKDGSETFMTIPAEVIVGGEVFKSMLGAALKQKTVLVGGNFYDRDQHLIPFSVLHAQWFPGLYIHAQVLAALTDPSRVLTSSPSWPGLALLVMLAAAGGIAVGRVPRLAKSHIWLEVVAVSCFVLISAATFWMFKVLFPFVSVLLGWGWGVMIGHMTHSSQHEDGDH